MKLRVTGFLTGEPVLVTSRYYELTNMPGIVTGEVDRAKLVRVRRADLKGSVYVKPSELTRVNT